MTTRNIYVHVHLPGENLSVLAGVMTSVFTGDLDHVESAQAFFRYVPCLCPRRPGTLVFSQLSLLREGVIQERPFRGQLLRKGVVPGFLQTFEETPMDNIAERLAKLQGGLPKPNTALSDAEKLALVQRVGVGTAKSILKAQKTLPLARIPFLFSAVDTQAVVDLLANDMTAAVAQAEKLKGPKRKK